MPEAPELEVVREFLTDKAVGLTIESASVLKPSVLRSMCGDIPSDIEGRTFDRVERRGKFMLFQLSGERMLVINPMLTGAIQYCNPKQSITYYPLSIYLL